LKEGERVRIAVLASGGGTNLQAIMDACASGRVNGEVSIAVSSLGKAGALERAAKAGIRAEALPLKDFPSPDAHDAALTELCRGAGLVCLAGWMLKLGPKFLSAFKGRILNIHPALLPAFGGKGFYGMRVHEAVLSSGVRLSGCTVHFVAGDYDSGPIIIQRSVPVFPDDTPASLAARVNGAELEAYPAAVSLFCDGLLELKDSRVLVKQAPADGRARRALVSLSDKTGAVDLARALVARGVEVVSTSGTYKLLKEAGLPVRPLESLTGFPEILDGRVKTLQPAVHGGILYRRDRAAHAEQLFRHGIEPIDIVAVNLYPFEKTAAKARAWSEELIEDIDIGGVALLRASAKNCASVTVLTDPADYPRVLDALDANAGKVPEALNRELAVKAFELTSSYDAAIAGKLGEEPLSCEFFPARLKAPLNKICDLRYGENPHQRAALYSKNPGLPFDKLAGKELSYNNILDAYGTWQAVNEFEAPACVIFKHVTPCGLGTGSNIREAFERAWNTDPLSAFGGIIAVNRTFDRGMAEFLSKKFVEVICAPDFLRGSREAVRPQAQPAPAALAGPAQGPAAVPLSGRRGAGQRGRREIAGRQVGSPHRKKALEGRGGSAAAGLGGLQVRSLQRHSPVGPPSDGRDRRGPDVAGRFRLHGRPEARPLPEGQSEAGGHGHGLRRLLPFPRRAGGGRPPGRHGRHTARRLGQGRRGHSGGRQAGRGDGPDRDPSLPSLKNGGYFPRQISRSYPKDPGPPGP